jgi:signal transduction histidine kinase
LKRHYYIYFLILLFHVACSDGNHTLVDNNIFKDSIDIYLSSANSDSIPYAKRLIYADLASKILVDKTNDSTNRVNLFKVANRYYNLRDYGKYKKTTKLILDRSIAAEDTAKVAKAYSYLGDYYFKTSSKDSAFFYYLKAEKIYSKLKDDVNLAAININKANVLWLESDFFGAESATLSALKHLRSGGDTRKVYESYTLLGLISNELSDYEKALQYQQKALEVVKDTLMNDPEHPIAVTLNNIGNIYQNLGNNRKAILKFEEALKEENLIYTNPQVYAIIIDNLAYSKFKLDKSDKEVPSLFEESLHINDSLQNMPLVIFSKVRYAEYFFAIGDTTKSIVLSKEALKLARANRYAADMLAPLKQLAVFEPKKASEYSEEYIKINDSLQQAERKSKDKFARIQFETDEISLEKNKLEEQNRNLYLFFVATIMIGLLLFIIRTQRARNRELLHKQAQQKANEDIYNLMLSQQNKIEEGRIKEKKRIAQELHDGVLGRLFGARLNLDSLNKLDGEDAEEKRNNYLSELKNIEQDIREISHDLNREKFVLINNFVAILNNLLEEQAAAFGTEVTSSVDEKIKWDHVSNSVKINLYRIIQESLQNINKYAKATSITVALKQLENNIRLVVADNGVGFSVDKKNKGIGLQNMMSRVSECDGTFDIKSKKGKGTTINIEFPIVRNPIIA